MTDLLLNVMFIGASEKPRFYVEKLAADFEYGKKHVILVLHYPIYYPSFYTSNSFFAVT